MMPPDAPLAVLERDTLTQPAPGYSKNPITGSAHPVAVYLARLAPGSRPAMRGALDAIARWASGRAGVGATVDAMGLPWAQTRYEHAAAIRSWLAETYAPATANKMLCALRGVLQECWRLGLLGADDYRRAVDVEPVRGSRPPPGRALERPELRRLLRACGAGPLAARDAALLAVLYTCGFRRAELVALDLADYDRAAATLTVRRGKGNKARVAYVNDPTAKRLTTWLTHRGDDDGPLFRPVRRGGHIQPGRLSAAAVVRALAERAAAAKVGHFSPHDLRRTFVSELLDRGVDLVTVQKMSGHSDPKTTARYDRRGDRARRAAADLLTLG